ncbi:MAG: hypothetical protein CL840_17465 [Crocinitomicaceae bacterium]|nr:hypothetical protein [Crocinitomicaceae bacterium]|tara:strand:- start:17316 stop:18023 length:708 start_codon:yes stop_codon:yes gene_type:complete
MKAIYIRGHNNGNVLSTLLLDAFLEVHEVVNVVDAVGLLRSNSYSFVFIYDKTVDIPIIQADRMLSKLIDNKHIYILSNEAESFKPNGVWVQLPQHLTDLSQIVQLDIENGQEEKPSKKIDLSQISILAKNDGSFMEDILSTFIEDSKVAIESFNQSLKERDIQGIGRMAHKIKGPLNILGVNSLDQELVTLDDLGMDNSNVVDWNSVQQSIRLILESLKQILGEVQEELLESKS